MNDENATVEGMVDLCLKYVFEHMNEDGAKIAFQIPNTKNFALLSFKADRGDDYWMFTVTSFRAGTDMLFSHFLSSGSKEEVVAYMKDEKERKKIADSVYDLSKKWILSTDETLQPCSFKRSSVDRQRKGVQDLSVPYYAKLRRVKEMKKIILHDGNKKVVSIRILPNKDQKFRKKSSNSHINRAVG